jgi:hypothetical protein
LPIFYPKNVTTFYQSPYSADLSQPDYFLLPKFKMKLKKGLHFVDVAEIRKAITDELKKVQKEEFSAGNCMTTQKPVYMPMELIFSKKKLSSIF